MQVPELYHYGRKHTWFGMRLFFVYMFDGLVQVSCRDDEPLTTC